MWKRPLLLFCLSNLLWGAAWSQAADPSGKSTQTAGSGGVAQPNATSSGKLGVLTLDAAGRWDADNQAHWQASPSNVVSDSNLLLRSSAVSRLSLEQRRALLSEPERLICSDRSTEIFTVDRILLLEPAVEDRVVAQYFDLSNGWHRTLISKKDQSADEGRQQLIQLASQSYGPNSVAVFANPQSGLYHQMDAQHVSPDIQRFDFPSLYLAEGKGFRPCAICFAGANRTLSQNDLERELGRILSARLEQEYRPSLDPALNERVQRVGHDLLDRNRIADTGYRFVVLQSDEINAFAVPTGPLYITTGLLSVVESDAELAGILGHELAHAQLHHGLRQYEQMQRLSWISLLATVATGSRWVYTASSFLSTLWTRGYSRDFEMEADRQGLWYTYGAGYRASDFGLTLHKFLDLEKSRGSGGGLTWLRTHPGNLDRISAVNQILDRLDPLSLILEEVEPVDAGLATYLKVHGSDFLEKPVETVEFLSAYRGLSLAPLPTAPVPGRPPALRPGATTLPDLR